MKNLAKIEDIQAALGSADVILKVHNGHISYAAGGRRGMTVGLITNDAKYDATKCAEAIDKNLLLDP